MMQMEHYLLDDAHIAVTDAISFPFLLVSIPLVAEIEDRKGEN